MEKELEEQLARLIKKGIETAEKTGQFIIDQSSDLIQEFYRWHIAKTSFSLIICISIILIFYKFIRSLGELEKTEYTDFKIFNRYYEECEKVIASFIFSGTISLFLIIFIAIGLFDLIQIIVAPKLYLIEYFIK